MEGGKSRGRVGFSLTAVPKAPWLHTWRGVVGTQMGFSILAQQYLGLGSVPACRHLHGRLPCQLPKEEFHVQQGWQKNFPRKGRNEVPAEQDGWTRVCSAHREQQNLPQKPPGRNLGKSRGALLPSPGSLGPSPFHIHSFFSIPRNVRELKPNTLHILGNPMGITQTQQSFCVCLRSS